MKKTTNAFLAAGIVSSLFIAADVFAADKVAATPAAPAAKAAPVKLTPEEAAKQVEARWAFLPEVVAEVDGKKITKAEIVKTVEEQISKSPFAAMFNSDMCKKMAPNLVKGMVEKDVLLKLAAAKGIVPSSKLVEEDFDQMVKKLPAKQIEMVEKQLAAQNKTLKSYRDEISKDKNAQDQAAIRTWVTKEIEPKVMVSDLEIKEYYEKNKDEFKEPAKVKASHILIKPEKNDDAAKKAAKAKAEAILADIKAGKVKFEDAAMKDSACPSGKQSKGSLGEFGKGEMVPEFEKVAFALKPGEMSGVVETPFGYHIIRCDDQKAEKILSLNDEKVKSFVSQTMKGEKIQKMIKDQLDAAKKTYKVKVYVQAEETKKDAALPGAKAPEKKK